MIICTNCDFQVENPEDIVIENNSCPHCGKECEIFEEMTDEQIRQLDVFFENGELIFSPDKENEAEPNKYLFENFETAEELVRASKEKLYINTVVLCDGDQAWILAGRRFVNRDGYFISKNDIEIPETGIRYW